MNPGTEQDKPVALVTHDPEAARFASHTIRMRQGQVIE